MSEPQAPPCENCEVLREENRALQRALETAREAYEEATAHLRVLQDQLAEEEPAGDTGAG